MEVGLYCDDDALHVECLQFCFLPLLKEELNHIAQHWNLHKIRPSINQESPPGRPDVLYFLPELKETISYLQAIDEDVKAVTEEMCCDNRALPSDGTLPRLVQMAMEEHNLQMGSTAPEASVLYSEPLYHLESMM